MFAEVNLSAVNSWQNWTKFVIALLRCSGDDQRVAVAI